ncbi:MAG: hypothetical protein HUK04_00315 [Bacteroidaceae bacterium]|nr:hypothetical protein [Bacteroidaceae bacterium]
MANKRREQAKLARLEIVSQLYLRQNTVRQIQAEVMKRLGLASYSTSTVQKDIKTVLKELQEFRLDNMEYVLQLELERIDDACRELWEQYQRSKEDRKEKITERKGVPTFGSDSHATKTTEIKQKERDVLGLGDPRYIAEIREQLKERRKLLGLYAPEKKEVSGEMSFAAMLMESGVIGDLDEGE